MGRWMIISVMVLLVTACATTAKPQDKPALEKPTGKPTEAPEKPKADPLKIYRNKGNTWTTRNTNKVGDKITLSYTKFEVIEVKELWAEVKQTELDADRKETDSRIYQESFPTSVDEKVRIAAGEFDCVREDSALPGYSQTVWHDKKWRIQVKSILRYEDSTVTFELAELNAGGEATDEFSIYRTKGNRWLVTRSLGAEVKLADSVETRVIEVTSEKATIQNFQYDDEGHGDLRGMTEDIYFFKPSIERVKVPAGEFECVKTMGRSWNGTPTATWTDKKWGIGVKTEFVMDETRDVSELVELNAK